MQPQTRMVLAYDNLLRGSLVPTITLTGCTAAAGSSVDNLKVEDPSLPLVTTVPTANPVIKVEWTSILPTGAILVGFINQNFWLTYTTLTVETSADGATGWGEIGRLELDLEPARTTSIGGTRDLLLRCNGTSTFRFWRFTFIKASAWPSITIGNIVLMRYYEVAKNPTRDLFRHRMVREQEIQRAMGGALHVTRGPARMYHGAEYTFTRIDEPQAQRLMEIAAVHGDRIVGVISAEQAAHIIPTGLGHLFCRIPEIPIYQPSPGVSDTTHKVNLTLRCDAGW